MVLMDESKTSFGAAIRLRQRLRRTARAGLPCRSAIARRQVGGPGSSTSSGPGHDRVWLMPKRQDIHSILIIGAGPIVIGQACEFDYSGAQACKALQGRGLPGRAGQFQPRDHHDRSGAGGRDLYRADHAGLRRKDHRPGKSERPERAGVRAAADDGRADRAQHRARPGRKGRARGPRHRDDRRQGRRPSPRPRTASCSARRWSGSGSNARVLYSRAT